MMEMESAPLENYFHVSLSGAFDGHRERLGSF